MEKAEEQRTLRQFATKEGWLHSVIMTRACYDTLADLLAANLNNGAIEIEIVASAALLPELESNPHAPFVFVEGHLGIPKKALYQAYLEACHAFAAHNSDILRSTSVILLANPAHSTALNAQKRIVISGLSDAEDQLILAETLLSEQQASKSSFLWHHRRWLLHQLYSPSTKFSDNLDACSGIPLDVLQKEISLAERAAERYPRNYFAWKHRRHCALHLANRTQELAATHSWIDQHISDYSAVHHTCTIVEPNCRDMLANNFNHAVSLVRLYPAHESLWIYLRIAYLRYKNLAALDSVNIDAEVLELRRQSGVDDSQGEIPPNSSRPVSATSTLQPEQLFASRCAGWLKLAPHFRDAELKCCISGAT